jgi:hypothetical protein
VSSCCKQHELQACPFSRMCLGVHVGLWVLDEVACSATRLWNGVTSAVLPC